jgi:cupin 2 domain-containing protein
MDSLFAELPASLPQGLVETLVDSPHVRIEKIVSTGQSSPDEFWYDRAETEWVVVLQGEAKVLFEDDDEPILMTPGDHVLIPAHRKHRVEWTTAKEPTVWLAVFFS